MLSTLTVLLLAGFARSYVAHHDQTPLTTDTFPWPIPIPRVCDCTGINFTNIQYICGDPRLGPVLLPRKYPLMDIVSTYDRFGGVQPAKFLQTFWDDTLPYDYKGIKGGWKYPPKDGFLFGPDNVTVQAYTTLAVGILLDRFGLETGRYLAAADAPFNQRALPPSNLNTGDDKDYPEDYHVYRVIKPLPVLAGVIAPGFGQPGLGAQFYIGGLAPNYRGNVTTALDLKYIEKVNKTLCTGPGSAANDPSFRCGNV